MLLFRSEEHVERWLTQWRLPRGEIFSLEQCWRLAQTWYSPDRREPAWRRKSIDEVEAVFEDLGFVSPFWRLR
jgi:hypothetical protein